MRQAVVFALFFWLLSFFGGSAAAAAERYWQIGADIGITYDSNVFATDADEESDSLVELRPWIELKRPVGDITIFRGKYILAGKMYSDFDDANTVEHDLVAEISFKGNRFYGKVFEGFIFKSYPISGEVVGKEDNWRNTLKAHFGAGYEKLGWEVGVVWERQDFKDIDAYDYDDYSFYAEGNYRFGTETMTYVTISIGEVTYSDDTHNDASYFDVKVGLRGSLADKTTYDLGAGMQSRDYDDGGTLADEEDYSSVSFAASLKYKYSEKTSVAASLSYKPTESVTANYYESLYFGLTVHWAVTEKIFLKSLLSLEDGKSSGAAENDFTKFTISASGHYAIRDWIGIMLEITAESRDTDAATGSYDRQTIGAFVSMRY
ncbi:MAG: hypothetical protein Kow00107_09170 [Planctomycetota bacterium]